MATEVTELKRRATMINDKVRMYLLPPLINAAVRAGASIMNVYKNLDDYDISLKDDKTPITLADRLAHKTIREYLGYTSGDYKGKPSNLEFVAMMAQRALTYLKK